MDGAKRNLNSIGGTHIEGNGVEADLLIAGKSINTVPQRGQRLVNLLGFI
tara:strand:+ start:550 stop:699 length:150 start_codon:yes stop_codon:yes gene_type:complete